MKTHTLPLAVYIKTYLFALLVLSGCNAPSQPSQSAAPTPSQGSPSVDPSPSPQASPSATPWSDHSYRNSSPYGTMPTADDCAYIAKWTPSLNETWYFAGYNNEALNKAHHLKFEHGAVVFRNWYEPEHRYINQFLTNELYFLGDCTIAIRSSTLGIDYVMWQNVVIH